MSKPYWKCERCGSEFPDTDIYVRESFDRNPAETQYCCPVCKSDWLLQGKICHYCGRWYDYDDEYFDDCCQKCGEDAVNAMNEYLSTDKPMTQEQKEIFKDYWGCL